MTVRLVARRVPTERTVTPGRPRDSYSPARRRVQRERQERVPERIVYGDLQLTGQPQQAIIVGQFTVTGSGAHDDDVVRLHGPRSRVLFFFVVVVPIGLDRRIPVVGAVGR